MGPAGVGTMSAIHKPTKKLLKFFLPWALTQIPHHHQQKHNIGIAYSLVGVYNYGTNEMDLSLWVQSLLMGTSRS